VQREILEADPTSELRVYTVWVPFLGASREWAHLSQRVMPDPRVLQYWDGSALTSEFFAKNVEHSLAPAWDVYYLYGPNATWSSVAGPLVSSGGTVIGESSALKRAITSLLAPASTP
jgi:hypothetical protein